MRFFLIFIAIFAMAHTNHQLDNDDIKYIYHKKTINVCINPDWSPIEFKQNNKPQGISIDILKLIAKKVNLKLNFINTKSWRESQKYIKEHKCDLTPTAIKTISRSKYAIFTKPYLIYDLAIITTEDKPYVTSIDSVSNKTITRKKGSGVITKLKNKYPNIKIIQTDSYLEMLQLVSNHKAYASIATLPVFAYYKKKYNLYNLKIAGFTGWKYELRMMINKNEPQLKEIINSELQNLSPKTIQNIYEKWTVQIKPQFDYEKFFIFLLVTLIILAILFIWIYILHKKNDELKKLSQAKSKFLSNMSHELRTPLNALTGFIQALKNDISKCEEYLPIIESTTQILISEIDDILNFDRLSNEIKIKNEEFNSYELKKALEFYELEAKNHNIKLIKDIQLPAYLYGDFEKIKDILIHLLKNAIKFTKKGEIKVTIKYQNDKLFVSIKDTGIGIAKDKLNDIFKAFHQLDDRINKEYSGIGLGLSIAKKLVEALGGKLHVKSKPNEGSEFYFTIPIKKIQHKTNSNKIKDKILVVEDNVANQAFMKIILHQMKIDFDIAENGKIAVEMYKKYHYPVILMDINMPIMDGITATKIIREYEKTHNINSSKIIAVTANAIDGDEERFLQAGLDDYIPKPVNIDKLNKSLGVQQ